MPPCTPLEDFDANAILDVLPADLAALLPDPVPSLVTPGWVADHFDVTTRTVINAIVNGTLPALPIPGGGGKTAVYAVRPRDAVRLWGRKRLRHDSEAQP